MASVRERQAAVKSRLISSIGRVELRVQDVARSLEFYRDIVGLQVSSQDGSTATLRSPGGEDLLVVDSSGVTGPADPTATGLFHTAIRFPSRAALGDALARLVEADFAVGAADHLVSQALYIDDPDGNGVELYWDRPAEEWPAPTDDMLVPMASLPVDMRGLLEEGNGRAAVGEPAPAGTDVGHVHLQVSDMDATSNFYRDVLGLDLTARLGGAAGFFSSNGYHHNIGANTWRSRGGKASAPERAGLQRIVFNVGDRDELARLRDRASGPSSPGSEDGDGVTVHDPDGIEMHFVHR